MKRAVPRKTAVQVGCMALALLGLASFVRSSTLRPGEQLLLYPAIARWVNEGWEVRVHGLVYEPERRRMMSALLRRAVGLLFLRRRRAKQEALRLVGSRLFPSRRVG